jgi:sugar phosphate isomerase/epimerase
MAPPFQHTPNAVRYVVAVIIRRFIMIRFAVMTFMYHGLIDKGEFSHAELVKLCAANGAKGLEVFHRVLVDNPKLRPLYRQLLADNNMSLPVIDVIVNLVYADAAGKKQGIDELRRGLDICAEMGAEIAHVAGCSPVAGVALDDARNMVADTLAEHAPMAKARGITLGIEDFDPSPTLMCSAADCLAILDRAKGAVKLVFDTGNFMAVGERADINLPKMYDRICSFHIKDYGRDPSDPSRHRAFPLGQGETPNAAVAKEVVRRGFNGWVALESLAGESPQVAIPQDMATLKGWFGVKG